LKPVEASGQSRRNQSGRVHMLKAIGGYLGRHHVGLLALFNGR
jgi:hypothetical protein